MRGSLKGGPSPRGAACQSGGAGWLQEKLWEIEDIVGLLGD